MKTVAQQNAARTAQSIVDHNARAGWDIEGTSHAFAMVLIDLIAAARVYGVDFDAELAEARVVVDEVYDAADLASLDNPALPTVALPDIARTAADQLLDALSVHIYSLEDGDRIPANSEHVETIQQLHAALALPPADIEVTPVWAYAATFANQHGERDDYQAEVLADTASDALDRGYADLLLLNPRATKIDGRADLVAGTPVASVEG